MTNKRALIVAVLALCFCGALLGQPTTSLAAGTIHVSTTVDEFDGVANANCSLREAIRSANTNADFGGCTRSGTAPYTITMDSLTFTLTRAGLDDDDTNGDLDILTSMSITGFGATVQAGTTASNGIDKVFSINPKGALAGFDVTLTGFTVRFGKNAATFASGDGSGGCIDYNGGTNNQGNLTLDTMIIDSCQTTDGDGGGIAIANPGFTLITNSTISHNTAHRPAGNSGQGGGMFIGCPAGLLTSNVLIDGTSITNNSAPDSAGKGGGINATTTCTGAQTVGYQLSASIVGSNNAGSHGGGLYSTAPWTITSLTSISSNTAGGDGGGVWIGAVAKILTANIAGNTASGDGGGVRVETNKLTMNYSRLVGNTATGGGNGLSTLNGTASVEDNWWGCSTGPNTSPCANATVAGGGSGTVDFTPYLRLLVSAATSPLTTNQASVVTASFNIDSANSDVSGKVDELLGTGIEWTSAGGTISNAQGFIQTSGALKGMATAVYTATAVLFPQPGGNTVTVQVDDVPAISTSVGIITVNKAPTTIAITADTPDPSVIGQPVSITFSLTSSAGLTPTAPTGNVSVTDFIGDTCQAPVATGSCNITFNSAGTKSLVASYPGDLDFLAGSPGGGASHTVNQSPNLTATKTDNVGHVVALGFGWQWTIHVANTGNGAATYATGNRLLLDSLPNANLSYGAVSVTNLTNVGGTIACAIAASDLTCTASGGAVTLGPTTGAFDVSFSATPSIATSYANPRANTFCQADPDSLLFESNEADNFCADTVIVVNDSDGDGYTDLREQSLGKNPSIYCGIMRADVDGDGSVSILDLAAVASHFLQSVPTAPQRLDQDQDNQISILDLAAQASRFLQSVTACP